MKKFSLVVALVLSIVMALSLTVSAGPSGITENAPIVVPNASPVIDGSIQGSAEGYSAVALMNANTLAYIWAQNPLTMDGNVFFAYDTNGIYVAANIQEGLDALTPTGANGGEINHVTKSTGEDDIDARFGWNGDVFIIAFDPLRSLFDLGFTANEDYAPHYCVGLFEEGARVYRTECNDAEITDNVTIAGNMTGDDSWCFEMMIPWDVLVDDINSVAMEDIVTAEKLQESGSLFKASAMYIDRFYDEEAEIVDTWGRFATVPKFLDDGTAGEKSSGDCIKAYGLNLFINSLPAELPVTTSPDRADEMHDTGDAVVTTAPVDAGTTVADGSTSAANGATTTAKQNTNKGTNGSSAQTFDIGIAIALGAIATSGVGIYATKKRK